MASRAPDIVELEELYINGESDAVLCKQASKIGDRFQVQIAFARARMDMSAMEQLQTEYLEFEALLKKIAGRSTAHDVLDAYKADARKKGRYP